MKAVQINEENIRHFLDAFYEKVTRDVELGPIFQAAIDQSHWQAHLTTMCDFWSAIMLGTRRYHGNPILKHQLLPPLNSTLFDRWLFLFEETAYQLYTENIAALYVDKSQRIAAHLKRKLDMSRLHETSS